MWPNWLTLSRRKGSTSAVKPVDDSEKNLTRISSGGRISAGASAALPCQKQVIRRTGSPAGTGPKSTCPRSPSQRKESPMRCRIHSLSSPSTVISGERRG
jgi:hypothetical protein